MHVGLYLRQSMDRSEGIDRQRARTTALAEARGWTVVTEYADNEVSATKVRGAKTGWARMLKDAEAGVIQGVVAVDLDRLLRNQRDLLTLLDAKLAVVTVDGELDLSTADGELRATMLAAFARFEVRHKGDRQKRANEARVAAGKPVPGRRRFGYESDNMTPREPEATVVRGMFRDFVKGASIRSLSLREGHRTGWVRELLKNQAYAGMVQHKGVFTPGKITPLVSADLSEKARAILADPARKTTPGQTPKHLMSGIAVCGVCGSHMLYMRAYRCRVDAKHPSMNKDKLDPLVMEEVFQWIVEHPDVEPSDDSPRLSALLAESAEVNRKRAALQDQATWEGVDLAKVRSDIAALGKTALRVEADITRERNATVRGSVVEQVRRLWWDRRDIAEFTEREEQALAEWPDFWNGLPLERQREIVRSMFVVEVAPGRDPYERTTFTWVS